MSPEETAMQAALRLATTVLPGGKIEVVDPQLPSGEAVDVIVLLSEPPSARRHSVVDVLSEAPGQILFRTAADVDTYLNAERDAWER
jgi:hypothetical protein